MFNILCRSVRLVKEPIQPHQEIDFAFFQLITFILEGFELEIATDHKDDAHLDLCAIDFIMAKTIGADLSDIVLDHVLAAHLLCGLEVHDRCAAFVDTDKVGRASVESWHEHRNFSAPDFVHVTQTVLDDAVRHTLREQSNEIVASWARLTEHVGFEMSVHEAAKCRCLFARSLGFFSTDEALPLLESGLVGSLAEDRGRAWNELVGDRTAIVANTVVAGDLFELLVVETIDELQLIEPGLDFVLLSLRGRGGQGRGLR